MQTIDDLKGVVRRIARRRRCLSAWEGLWRGALAGGAVYLVALAAYKALPVPVVVVDVGLWVGVACLLVPAVAGLMRRVSDAQAARLLDARAGLKERVSTALEMAGGKPSDPWGSLVVQDAAAASAGVRAGQVVPFRVPRSSRWTLVVLALGAGLGFVPEYRTAEQRQQALDRGVIQDVGRNLVQVSKREVAQRPPASEEVRQALDEMGELGERLQSASLTRDTAMKDLAKATEGLKEQAMELARNPALRRLEQAARNAGGTPGQTPEAVQRQIDALKNALGDKAPSEDAARELQRDVQRLQKEASGMAGKDGKDGGARQQMEQSMAELARKAEAMGIDLDSIESAMAALKQADIERFLQNLETASTDLERMADMAQTLSQLQQQASRTGKDLAEQLSNGEAQAAAETLQRMIEQLKSGAPPEKLAEMAREAMKGAEAGRNYGEVGSLLKKAGESLSKGEAGASGDLAAAKEELQRLMDQMGDAQALMAAMQALQKAQMCVGNGQCWGTKPGNSGKISAGKGGKGGRGVGTWSESDAWAMPDSIQDLWDNSGINRPDMAGKGNTERDVTTPDGLVPTKIKGDMQPGGPMPSIPLRGVSIKGQSRVAFTEAVAAAQSEARSALTEEQVPKAYQNSVRDYFDDLK